MLRYAVHPQAGVSIHWFRSRGILDHQRLTVEVSAHMGTPAPHMASPPATDRATLGLAFGLRIGERSVTASAAVSLSLPLYAPPACGSPTRRLHGIPHPQQRDVVAEASATRRCGLKFCIQDRASIRHHPHSSRPLTELTLLGRIARRNPARSTNRSQVDSQADGQARMTGPASRAFCHNEPYRFRKVGIPDRCHRTSYTRPS